jgi:hypothetical protein
MVNALRFCLDEAIKLLTTGLIDRYLGLDSDYLFEAGECTSFGTRGSQVQILPLRPTLPKLSIQTGTTSGTDTPAANGILSKRKMAQPKESIRKITKPVAEKYARLTQFWKSSRNVTANGVTDRCAGQRRSIDQDRVTRWGSTRIKSSPC